MIVKRLLVLGVFACALLYSCPVGASRVAPDQLEPGVWRPTNPRVELYGRCTGLKQALFLQEVARVTVCELLEGVPHPLAIAETTFYFTEDMGACTVERIVFRIPGLPPIEVPFHSGPIASSLGSELRVATALRCR